MTQEVLQEEILAKSSVPWWQRWWQRRCLGTNHYSSQNPLYAPEHLWCKLPLQQRNAAVGQRTTCPKTENQKQHQSLLGIH